MEEQTKDIQSEQQEETKQPVTQEDKIEVSKETQEQENGEVLDVVDKEQEKQVTVESEEKKEIEQKQQEHQVNGVKPDSTQNESQQQESPQKIPVIEEEMQMTFKIEEIKQDQKQAPIKEMTESLASVAPTEQFETPYYDMYDTDLGELESLPINENYKEFRVSKPMKNATHITYEVTGQFIDHNKSQVVQTPETFVAQKRYKDFVALRESLLIRWPGFFIPAIPPKQTFGNMEKDFVLERKDQLDNFIRQLAKYEFLVNSFEFCLFASFSGDALEQQYKALLIEKPERIYEKYQKLCPIYIYKHSDEKKAKCSEVIHKFNLFTNLALKTMQSEKSIHEELAERREVQNKNTKDLLNQLYQYEQTGLEYYGRSDHKSSITERRLVYQDLDQTVNFGAEVGKDEYGNPYRVMYRWIQIEIQDLLAIKDCTQGIQRIEKTIRELKGEIVELNEYKDDIIRGKTSWKGIWAKITGKEETEQQVQTRINATQKDVDEWTKVLEYITLYIPLVVLPRFKRDRGSQYFRFLTNFATSHIKSCEKKVSIWEPIIKRTEELVKEKVIINM